MWLSSSWCLLWLAFLISLLLCIFLTGLENNLPSASCAISINVYAIGWARLQWALPCTNTTRIQTYHRMCYCAVSVLGRMQLHHEWGHLKATRTPSELYNVHTCIHGFQSFRRGGVVRLCSPFRRRERRHVLMAWPGWERCPPPRRCMQPPTRQCMYAMHVCNHLHGNASPTVVMLKLIRQPYPAHRRRTCVQPCSPQPRTCPPSMHVHHPLHYPMHSSLRPRRQQASAHSEHCARRLSRPPRP